MPWIYCKVALIQLESDVFIKHDNVLKAASGQKFIPNDKAMILNHTQVICFLSGRFCAEVGIELSEQNIWNALQAGER